MRNILVLFLLFVSTQVFAKYYPGIIYLHDGSVIEADIEIPSQPKELFIKYTVGKDNLFLRSEEINLFVIYFKKETSSVFSYLEIENGFEAGLKKWVVLGHHTPHMDVYTLAHSYEVDKHNVLRLKTSDLNFNHGIAYYMKKKTAQKLYYICEYNDGMVDHKDFYENAAAYCKDELRLERSILKKEFKWKDIYKIAEVYNTFKEYKQVRKEQLNGNSTL